MISHIINDILASTENTPFVIELFLQGCDSLTLTEEEANYILSQVTENSSIPAQLMKSVAYYRLSEPKKGIKLLQGLSQQGNMLAMFFLIAYQWKNCSLSAEQCTQAIQLFEKNFEEQNERFELAMYLRGMMYQFGHGEADNRPNYAAAKILYDKAIEKGHANAMNSRALMYENGHGEAGNRPNYAKAKDLYDKAIEKGLANAMNSRAFMYLRGKGEAGNRPDYEKAQILYDKAIEKGLAVAMCSRAWMYLEGKGEADNRPDYAAAKILYDKAIEKGHAEAMYSRAFMYQQGQGEADNRPNYEKAKILYDKVIEKGHAKAMYCRALMYQQGQGEAENRPNYEKAKILYDKAIEKGLANAMYNRALMYLRGKGEAGNRPDYEKAKILYDKAIEKGFANAMCNRAEMYQEGQGEADNRPNYEKAKILYDKAIEKGHAEAMYSRALMYQHGQGEADNRPNYEKAKILYDKAIEKGLANAMNNRASMYLRGKGEAGNRPNYEKAKILFDKAIEKGHLAAMNNRALMYQEGQGEAGNRPNYEKAKILFDKAIEKGHLAAMNNRAFMYQQGEGETGNRPNYEKAKALLDQAIEKGDAYAMYGRAFMYQRGQGEADNKPDYIQTIRLYSDALSKDPSLAQHVEKELTTLVTQDTSSVEEAGYFLFINKYRKDALLGYNEEEALNYFCLSSVLFLTRFIDELIQKINLLSVEEEESYSNLILKLIDTMTMSQQSSVVVHATLNRWFAYTLRMENPEKAYEFFSKIPEDLLNANDFLELAHLVQINKLFEKNSARFATYLSDCARSKGDVPAKDNEVFWQMYRNPCVGSFKGPLTQRERLENAAEPFVLEINTRQIRELRKFKCYFQIQQESTNISFFHPSNDPVCVVNDIITALEKGDNLEKVLKCTPEISKLATKNEIFAQLIAKLTNIPFLPPLELCDTKSHEKIMTARI